MNSSFWWAWTWVGRCPYFTQSTPRTSGELLQPPTRNMGKGTRFSRACKDGPRNKPHEVYPARWVRNPNALQTLCHLSLSPSHSQHCVALVVVVVRVVVVVVVVVRVVVCFRIVSEHAACHTVAILVVAVFVVVALYCLVYRSSVDTLHQHPLCSVCSQIATASRPRHHHHHQSPQ
jgi:hypothetical protein